LDSRVRLLAVCRARWFAGQPVLNLTLTSRSGNHSTCLIDTSQSIGFVDTASRRMI